MRWCFTHEGRELLLHPGCCAVGFTYQDGCSGTCDIGTTMRVDGPVYQYCETCSWWVNGEWNHDEPCSECGGTGLVKIEGANGMNSKADGTSE